MMLPDFRVRQRDYLLEISRALTQELDLEELLDSAADGILILHADLTIERVNDAFERMYGKTHDELVNLSHDDVIRWASDPQGSTLNEAIANGWPLTPNASLYVEGDLARPLPPPLPVGVTYAPLLASD